MTTAVAIALYNGEKFIEKQLDSLRLQTKLLDQVVLCDDGSKDGTVAFVQDYITRHGLADRWMLSINPSNLGYAGNFYHAMEQCHTDLIFLCDQDDIWRPDKIEKMAAVMESHPEITLLSSRYGVIDAQDQPIQGVLVPKEQEGYDLHAVTTEEIMRSFHWPGMCMCMRRDCFQKILPYLEDHKIPHDVVLAVCAADDGGFWEYSYIGADHRRHTNNTGKEEHRISKVLNLKRKLSEVEAYNDMLERIVCGKLPLKQETRSCIQRRLNLSLNRRDALATRSMSKLKKAYSGEGKTMLRKKSLLCDAWLILFGNYKELED